jgi:hypothetical protein
MDMRGFIIKMEAIILECLKMVNGMVKENSFILMVKSKKASGKIIFLWTIKINDYMSIFKYIK